MIPRTAFQIAAEGPPAASIFLLDGAGMYCTSGRALSRWEFEAYLRIAPNSLNRRKGCKMGVRAYSLIAQFFIPR
jgi:hypothetical protein